MDELNAKLDEIADRLDTLYKTERARNNNQIEVLESYEVYELNHERDLCKIAYDNTSLSLTEILIETGHKTRIDISKYVIDTLYDLCFFTVSKHPDIYFKWKNSIVKDKLNSLDRAVKHGVSIADKILDTLTKSEMLSNNNYEGLEHYVLNLMENCYSKNQIKNDDDFRRVLSSYRHNSESAEKEFPLEELNIQYKEKMLEYFDRLNNVLSNQYHDIST